MHAEELEPLPFFAELSPSQLQRLAQCFEVVDYPAGALIFAAGDRANRLYIVHTGEVVIRYQPHDGGALDIATLTAGGTFGWSAALKRTYYTSSALGVTAVQALTIAARDLHQIMAADPALGEVLLARAAQLASSRRDNLGQQVIRLLKPHH